MKSFRISKLKKKHTNKEAILKGIWDVNEKGKRKKEVNQGFLLRL